MNNPLNNTSQPAAYKPFEIGLDQLMKAGYDLQTASVMEAADSTGHNLVGLLGSGIDKAVSAFTEVPTPSLGAFAKSGMGIAEMPSGIGDKLAAAGIKFSPGLMVGGAQQVAGSSITGFNGVSSGLAGLAGIPKLGGFGLAAA